ncbi:phage major capsid protein, P2 family [Silvimonas sp.]|uniref:phage major capsid protein, P2 family n=1 Tax=Silvimonas sp. TaxID=2650811 RepID=UPI00283F43AC|nr:phage major capsid protein, P2 family [Silvimonas sp.]MDR3429030.1 phage major capsid protein, P2 family [Silvimonas sp.]
MRKVTREKFNLFTAQVASLNDVGSVTDKFAVAPSIQQTLETKIQESASFLKQINMVGVDEQEGEAIGLGVGSTVASTTDTTQKDRETADPSTLVVDRYRCEQTNFDTHITYQKLDAWAKFTDFQARLRDAIIQRQALDRIVIGFNGVKRVATSNRANNPLLQDVNIGWLQKYRENAAQRVMTSGKVDTEISIGEHCDYENIDALVMDAINNLIDPWYQDDTGLVAICGRKLLSDKYFPMVNQSQRATDQLATDIILSQKRIGGLPAARVPFFPADAILITRFDNLSLYWQNEKRRRNIIDNSRRDRIENFESSNDAYVIEDYGCGALIENIVMHEAAGVGA